MNFKQWEKILILGLADTTFLIAEKKKAEKEKRKGRRKVEREGQKRKK